jgi:hypothetical protein
LRGNVGFEVPEETEVQETIREICSSDLSLERKQRTVAEAIILL